MNAQAQTKTEDFVISRSFQAPRAEMLPDMMRWLWRDHPVSTDPRDTTERSMRSPAARK